MDNVVDERPSVLKSNFENERIDNGRYKFHVELSINFPISTFNSVVHFLVVSGTKNTRREEYHVTSMVNEPVDPTKAGQATFVFDVEVSSEVLTSKDLRFEISRTKTLKNSPEGFVEVRDGVFFNNALPINLQGDQN